MKAIITVWFDSKKLGIDLEKCMYESTNYVFNHLKSLTKYLELRTKLGKVGCNWSEEENQLYSVEDNIRYDPNNGFALSCGAGPLQFAQKITLDCSFFLPNTPCRLGVYKDNGNLPINAVLTADFIQGIAAPLYKLYIYSANPSFEAINKFLNEILSGKILPTTDWSYVQREGEKPQ